MGINGIQSTQPFLDKSILWNPCCCCCQAPSSLKGSANGCVWNQSTYPSSTQFLKIQTRPFQFRASVATFFTVGPWLDPGMLWDDSDSKVTPDISRLGSDSRKNFGKTPFHQCIIIPIKNGHIFPYGGFLSHRGYPKNHPHGWPFESWKPWSRLGIPHDEPSTGVKFLSASRIGPSNVATSTSCAGRWYNETFPWWRPKWSWGLGKDCDVCGSNYIWLQMMDRSEIKWRFPP